MPTVPAAGRHDLANCEWSVLEPLLPAGKKAGRPPKWARRQLIDGIRWRIRAGAPWRDVPPCYGPWQSVYGLFRCWQRDGTWRKIVTALQALADAAGHVTWDVSVDSGTARAHQHAAGARKDRVCQIFCARGLFAVRFREFIPNRFLALSDAVLPGLSRGSAEPDFPCRSGADAACPGFPGVLCCCGCLLPDPPGIVWRAIPVCH